MLETSLECSVARVNEISAFFGLTVLQWMHTVKKFRIDKKRQYCSLFLAVILAVIAPGQLYFNEFWLRTKMRIYSGVYYNLVVPLILSWFLILKIIRKQEMYEIMNGFMDIGSQLRGFDSPEKCSTPIKKFIVSFSIIIVPLILSDHQYYTKTVVFEYIEQLALFVLICQFSLYVSTIAGLIKLINNEMDIDLRDYYEPKKKPLVDNMLFGIFIGFHGDLKAEHHQLKVRKPTDGIDQVEVCK